MEIITPRHLNQMAPANGPATKHVDAQNTSPVMGEGLVRDPSLDVYQQSIQFSSQLNLEGVETQFRENAISGNFDEVMKTARSMMMAMKNSADKYSRLPQKVEDGRGHISATHNLVKEIHGNYQKKYGEIVKASTQYMQDVNTAIGKMSSHIQAGSDGKVNFKPEAFLKEIDKIVQNYSGKSYAGSGSSAGEYFGNWNADLSQAKPLSSIKGSQQEFDFWNKKLSGQGFIVEYENGNIKVYPDMKPIKEIYSTVASSSASWGGSDIIAQELQSLQTAIDSQKNAVNNSVSRLLETFRQDNSHFETLVQLLIQLIKDLNQNNNSLINM